MLKSKLLRISIITILVMTILVPVAQACLVAGSPENVISNSTLILTGKVITSNEVGEKRTFTVSVDRVLKGEYSKPEIVFTGRKNPIYGWMGGVHTLPEKKTELLLFLRNDDNDNPYFTFDLNCIAIVEGQRVTSLLGGSNIGLNDERWEIEDYVKTYNEFFNTIEHISAQTEETTTGEKDKNKDLSPRSMAVAASASIFWPGIIAFLILLGLLLVGLWYYAHSKQNRSPLFWIAGIVVCIAVSYIIATFALTPLLIR